MLNPSQIQTLLMLRNHALNHPNDPTYSMFSKLPEELIREISELGQNPGSDFDKALKDVAQGQLPQAKAILEEASNQPDKTKLKELLLSSGTAVTRCGLIVKHKTLLECALGEGDPDMIKMIKSYFAKFDHDEKEMEKQLRRYRPCIIAMQNQKPDDLTWLFNIIKKSSVEDVEAELATGEKYDKTYQSPLRFALNQFREAKLDPKVRVITKPRMHCNYQNILHAYTLFYYEWKNLIEKKNGKDCYIKNYLVAQQVIGLIQLLELPTYERYLFARAQFYKAVQGEEIERSLKLKYSDRHFVDFVNALLDSHSGHGFDSFVTIYGGVDSWDDVTSSEPYPCCGNWVGSWIDEGYKPYLERKISELQNLCAELQTENVSVCNLSK